MPEHRESISTPRRHPVVQQWAELAGVLNKHHTESLCMTFRYRQILSHLFLLVREMLPKEFVPFVFKAYDVCFYLRKYFMFLHLIQLSACHSSAGNHSCPCTASNHPSPWSPYTWACTHRSPYSRTSAWCGTSLRFQKGQAILKASTIASASLPALDNTESISFFVISFGTI